MKEDGLYVEVRKRFNDLLQKTATPEYPNGDPNKVNVKEWHIELVVAISTFLEKHVKCYCTYSGILPSGTPDPIVADFWYLDVKDIVRVDIPVDYNTWVTNIDVVLKVSSLIKGKGDYGIIIEEPLQVLGSSVLSLPQNTLRSKSPIDVLWDWVGDEILKWYKSNVNPTGTALASNPLSGSTGTVTLTSMSY